MSARIVTFTGNHGQVDFEYPSGALIAYRPDPDTNRPDAYADYVRADFDERRSWYAAHGLTLSDPQPDGDIVDIGVWLTDGSYLPAEGDWRIDWLADYKWVQAARSDAKQTMPADNYALKPFTDAVRAHLDASPAPSTRKATVTWDSLLALLPQAEHAAKVAATERAELIAALQGLIDLCHEEGLDEGDDSPLLNNAKAVIARVQP